jgi:hypothetical protein
LEDQFEHMGVIVIDLSHTSDYVYMFLITAGLGAIGGLGAELLLKRADNTGTIEIPRRLNASLIDLGFPASLILGAIAAVAATYFFPPVVEQMASGINGGAVQTTREYNLLKLVPLALIVGSAGPAFLASAQARLMSALNAQKVETTAAAAKTQFKQLADTTRAAVPMAVEQAVAGALPDAQPEQIAAAVASVSHSMNALIQPQVKSAAANIDAIAPAALPPHEG